MFLIINSEQILTASVNYIKKQAETLVMKDLFIFYTISTTLWREMII